MIRIDDTHDAATIKDALEHLGPLSDVEEGRCRDELQRIIREFRELRDLLEHSPEPDWGELAEQLKPLRKGLRKVADILDALDYEPAFHAPVKLSSAQIRAPLTTDMSFDFIVGRGPRGRGKR